VVNRLAILPPFTAHFPLWGRHEVEVKVETATPAEGDAVGVADSNWCSALIWPSNRPGALYS
jgi:hypothetical protein